MIIVASTPEDSEPESHAYKKGVVRFRLVEPSFDAGVDVEIFSDGVDDSSQDENGVGVRFPVRVALCPYVGDEFEFLLIFHPPAKEACQMSFLSSRSFSFRLYPRFACNSQGSFSFEAIRKKV